MRVIQLLEVIAFTITHSYLPLNEKRLYQSKKSGWIKMKHSVCMKWAANVFLSSDHCQTLSHKRSIFSISLYLNVCKHLLGKRKLASSKWFRYHFYLVMSFHRFIFKTSCNGIIFWMFDVKFPSRQLCTCSILFNFNFHFNLIYKLFKDKSF